MDGIGLRCEHTLQTGKPFSITDSQAGTIYGVSSYAQFAPGKSAADAVMSGRTESRLSQYFNTSVFQRQCRRRHGYLRASDRKRYRFR